MKIQTGCIQTILHQNGRLSHYRLTLPVPYSYVLLHGMDSIMIKSNKKGTLRYFYCPESMDFDSIEQKKIACQLLVNTLKMQALEARQEMLLSKLSSKRY